MRSGVVVKWLTALNTVHDDDMLCASVLGAGKARAAIPIVDKHTTTVTAADTAVNSSSSNNSSTNADASAAAASTEPGLQQAGKLCNYM